MDSDNIQMFSRKNVFDTEQKMYRVIHKFLRNFRTRREHFLIHCACHFSSRLPPSGGTCKYAKAPSTKTILRDSLPIDMLLSALSFLVVAQSSPEVPEGLMNNPVFIFLLRITLPVITLLQAFRHSKFEVTYNWRMEEL